MRRLAILGVMSLALGGCATQKAQTVDAASRSSGAAGDAMNQTASGVGGAVRAPLRDFNLMQEEIPAALIRAQKGPYDIAGMDNCDSLLLAVGELDLALGPDVDIPDVERRRDAYDQSASFAAQTALDAVKDTAEGVIPMKSWVRRLSGADKAEAKVRRAISAGTARRSFLKGLGVMHNCAWPAAPLSFEPRKIQIGGSPEAAAAPSAPAAEPVAEPVARPVKRKRRRSVSAAPPPEPAGATAPQASGQMPQPDVAAPKPAPPKP